LMNALREFESDLRRAGKSDNTGDRAGAAALRLLMPHDAGADADADADADESTGS